MRRIVLFIVAFVVVLATGSSAWGTHNPNNDVDLDVEHGLPLFWSDPIPLLNLYWDTDWDNHAGHGDVSRAAIDGALEDLLDSDYFDSLDEYDVPSFAFAGSVQTQQGDNLCSDEPGAQVSTAELLLFVECELFLHPQLPDGPRIVNLFVPAGTRIVDEVSFELDNEEYTIGRVSCDDYGAYHAFTASHWLTIIPVECFDSFGGVTAALSHEIVEAATDPLPLGYWIDIGSVPADVWDFLSRVPGLVAAIPQLLSAGEIADICETRYTTDVGDIAFTRVPIESDPDSIAVGSYWSNEQNACVVGEDRVVATLFTAANVPAGAGAVVVDGIEHELPYAQMLREGSEYEFVRERASVLHRFEPSAGCSGVVTFPDGNVTADASRTISCSYQEEFWLDVDTVPSEVEAIAELTPSGWYAAGVRVDLEAEDPVQVDAGSRYVFDSWGGEVAADGVSVVIDQPRNVWATYGLEHEVRLGQSGIPAATLWSLTVDGGDVSGPHSAWVPDGADLSFDYPAIVDPLNGTRYVLGGVSHTSPLEGVTEPIDVTATYGTQYLLTLGQTGIPAGVPWTLTVDSSEEAGPYERWLEPDSVVTFTYDGIVPDSGDPGTRYSLAGVSDASPVTMTGPVAVVGSYGTEYLLTVQSSGLDGNTAQVTNDGVFLGDVADAVPLSVWLPSLTSIVLDATDPVDGADAVQYFLDGFDPDPSGPLTSGTTTTSMYRTMDELIQDALTGGGIDAQGLANALTRKFENGQEAIERGDYADALDPIASFIDQVAAQSGKKIDPALADELTLDAAVVFHATLCKAVDAGQVDPATEAEHYAYYGAVVTGAGGTPLPGC